MTTNSAAELCALTERFDLALDPDSVRFNEAGLDYRVAFASETGDGPGAGREWVLRIPRRPDVSRKVADEKRILDFVAPRLAIAVPDWQIVSPDLIAYPLLPGKPGLTLDNESQPVWHFDLASPAYAQSLAEVISALHSLDKSEAEAAGIPGETPGQVRQRWAEDLERVLAEFDVDAGFVASWRKWIDEESLWPERTAFTHGELYPAHLLLDDHDRVVSALDWTTARVSDPALDFMYQYLIAPPEVFAATVSAYGELTGRVETNLGARCQALIDAGPLNYALFALQSGDPAHRAAAESQLNPGR